MKPTHILFGVLVAVAIVSSHFAQESVRVLAYSGQALPTGGSVAALNLARVNSFGRVAFLMADTRGGFLPWSSDGETLNPMLTAAIKLEGVPEGVSVFGGSGTESSGWLGLSSSGSIATYVRLEGSGVTDSSALAILVASPTRARIVARAGDSLPGGTGRFALVSTLLPPLPVLNARDEIAFATPDSPPTHPFLRTVTAGNVANLSQWRGGRAAGVGLLDDGLIVGVGETNAGVAMIFQGTPSAPQSILAVGDPAPGLPGEIVAESNFQLAAESRGRLGVVGRTRRTNEFSTRLTVWEGYAGRLTVALREGDVIDGLVVREIDSIRINATGTMAARVSLAESMAAADRTGGIILRANGAWQTVARVGLTAPGADSGRFANVDAPVLNALGQVAFSAVVTGGGRQHGIWGGPAGDLRALVRDGDVILLPSGQTKTIGLVGGFGSGGGSPSFGVPGGVSPLGDAGVLAQRVTFTDNNQAVIAVGLPLTRPTLADDRLINISTRAEVAGGDNLLVAGFVVSGSSTQRFLIRGLGPVLADFGVTGSLATPDLRLFRGTEELAQNRGWSNATNAAEIETAARSVGAFSLPNRGADSAILVALPAGGYTAQLGAAGSTGGVGLIEVYHVRDGAAPGRPVNLSSRAVVGRGAGILIPGIVVDGTAPKSLLIRAVGPTLAADFGLGAALIDPQMAIFSGSVTVAANDNWGSGLSASTLRKAAEMVGAFPLREESKDAALFVTLPPGNYTIQVSGRGDTTGIALVEVYELGTL